MNIVYLFMLMYFSGLVTFSIWRKHFLIMLLSLEFITLSIFFSLFMLLNYNFMNLFFCMIYLTMAVCEGVLGLSIMVMSIRSVGNEFMMSLNSLW